MEVAIGFVEWNLGKSEANGMVGVQPDIFLPQEWLDGKVPTPFIRTIRRTGRNGSPIGAFGERPGACLRGSGVPRRAKNWRARGEKPVETAAKHLQDNEKRCGTTRPSRPDSRSRPARSGIRPPPCERPHGPDGRPVENGMRRGGPQTALAEDRRPHG